MTSSIDRAPRHYNPMPMFGLRVQLSRTAQALVFIAQRAGESGVDASRVAPLLYMSDVLAREHFGKPITDIEWRRDMLASEDL